MAAPGPAWDVLRGAATGPGRARTRPTHASTHSQKNVSPAFTARARRCRRGLAVAVQSEPRPQLTRISQASTFFLRLPTERLAMCGADRTLLWRESVRNIRKRAR